MPETQTVFSGRAPICGERALHGLQDRVVAAAGAPAHFLIGREVGGLELRESIHGMNP